MIETVLKKKMLSVVRSRIEYRLGLRDAPEPCGNNPFYHQKRGLFVTLHKHGDLRGCIGYIRGTSPLSEALSELSESAAFRDPRFMPVTADEMEHISIEISLLSPLRTVSHYSQIHVGEHGVLMKHNGRQSVFLPQVAEEQGWDLETMLRHLSRKAGLPDHVYRNDDTEFEVFTAEVFSEHDAE